MTLLLVAGLLVGAIGWEYAPALRGGFVYEDGRTTDVCAEGLSWSPRLGRRLTIASWCAQRGQSPRAFHLVNIGLHLTVTALVGLLVWTLTREPIAALVAAAFFGLNAVNVEAVAYLSGRSELIAAIGVLGACLAALSQRWLWVLPLLWLGWCGKESAVIGLVLIPLCHWYQGGRPWVWVMAIMAAILSLEIVRHTAAWWLHAPSHGAWALTQTSAIVRVLMLSLFPFGQTVDYDYARVPVLLQVFAAGMLMAGLIWALRHGNRLLLCGAIWTLCACAPRLLVPTPLSVFPEHQFYLPLVGVALILASLLTKEPYDGHCATL